MPTEPTLLIYGLGLANVLAVDILTLALLASHPRTRHLGRVRQASPSLRSSVPLLRVASQTCWPVVNLYALWPYALCLGTASFMVVVWSALTTTHEQFPIALLLGSMLSALALFDAIAFVLPNPLCAALAVSGLVLGALSHPDEVIAHLATMIAAGGALYAVNTLYKRLRGSNGIGMGDIKLFAAAGAWLPLAAMPTCLFIGTTAAAVYGSASALVSGSRLATKRVPFGAFICFGIWLTWLYGPLSFV